MTEKSDPKVDTQELIAMVKDWVEASPPTPREIVTIVLAATDALIRGDQLRIGNLQAEFETFQAFNRKIDPKEYLLKSMLKISFAHWAAESPNSFAITYRRGRADERKTIATKNAKRATKGRQEIGAASRDRVRKASADYRHLSKELAAPKIAEAANLSPGTVRRYLSELFPGVEWKNL